MDKLRSGVIILNFWCWHDNVPGNNLGLDGGPIRVAPSPSPASTVPWSTSEHIFSLVITKLQWCWAVLQCLTNTVIYSADKTTHMQYIRQELKNHTNVKEDCEVAFRQTRVGAHGPEKCCYHHELSGAHYCKGTAPFANSHSSKKPSDQM